MAQANTDPPDYWTETAADIEQRQRVTQQPDTNTYAYMRNFELVPLTERTAEFLAVENQLLESLPDYEVTTIQRIQHRLLWSRYAARMQELQAKNGKQQHRWSAACVFPPLFFEQEYSTLYSVLCARRCLSQSPRLTCTHCTRLATPRTSGPVYIIIYTFKATAD